MPGELKKGRFRPMQHEKKVHTNNFHQEYDPKIFENTIKSRLAKIKKHDSHQFDALFKKYMQGFLENKIIAEKYNSPEKVKKYINAVINSISEIERNLKKTK